MKYFDKGDYQVYFTTRSQSKADKIIQEHQLKAQSCLVDLSSLQSVTNLAKVLKKQLSHLDILINNAGTWQMDFQETQDGIEMNFAVNHLAPMLLTLELLPLLHAGSSSRIINTSREHIDVTFCTFLRTRFRHTTYNRYSPTYSQSKLCNIPLFFAFVF